jgi:hypothetical protein
MPGDVESRVRFLHDSALWCWELFDSRTGAVMASSWTELWEAYPSPERASAAAAEYLRQRDTRRAA